MSETDKVLLPQAFHSVLQAHLQRSEVDAKLLAFSWETIRLVHKACRLHICHKWNTSPSSSQNFLISRSNNWYWRVKMHLTSHVWKLFRKWIRSLILNAMKSKKAWNISSGKWENPRINGGLFFCTRSLMYGFR